MKAINYGRRATSGPWATTLNMIEHRMGAETYLEKYLKKHFSYRLQQPLVSAKETNQQVGHKKVTFTSSIARMVCKKTQFILGTSSS